MKRLKGYYGLVYLLVLLVILPIVVYRSAISGTLEVKSLLKEQNREIAVLKIKQSQKAKVIASNTDEISTGDLLARIQTKAERHSVTVERFTPYSTTKEDNMRIMTAEIVMQGSYIPSVRTIAFIENEITTCKLVSVNCKTITDRRKKEKQLKTTLLVQQIIQN